jgi:glutamate synthase (NADPH/NADH) small chain
MDCGIAFCHWACPLGNKMPEWQDHIYKGEWKKGVDVLMETNNFPEFTGRICPAPCEKSCVLALHEAPVTIRENEASVTEERPGKG